MSFLKEQLTEAAINVLDEAVRKVGTSTKNKRLAGRRAFVNRIRNGKVQMRHMVSQVDNFKVVNGQLVMMKPEERRKRKRAAKISARKRAVKQAQILRKRQISMRRRQSRFGN